MGNPNSYLLSFSCYTIIYLIYYYFSAALFCGNCQACFSTFSKLQKNNNDEEDPSRVWKCEYCNHLNNDILLDDEEIPKSETIDYILEGPAKGSGANNNNNNNNNNGGNIDGNNSNSKGKSDDLLILCMDVSGSMCVTAELPKSLVSFIIYYK